MGNFTTVNEFFPKELQDKIEYYITREDLPDNNMKADKLVEILEPYGFYEVGCGTNRVVLSHPKNHDVVLKIALDKVGKTDNAAEYMLSEELSEFVTQTYDTNNTIAVAERIDGFFKKEDFEFYLQEALYIINSLIRMKYIVNDIGPKSFMNYGIDNFNKLRILDYAYLTPLTPEIYDRMFCTKDGAPLQYNRPFTKFICPNCHTTYDIGQIAPTIKEEVGPSLADDII